MKITQSFDTSWFVEQEQKIAEASRPRVEYVRLLGAPTTDYGHIYVIEFSTGVVKVGRTIGPARRLATHARVAQVHGVAVRRSWTSERHHGCRETERKLIDLCRRRGTQIDVEYFQGITFEDVRAIAQLLAEDATASRRLASRIADDKARRAYLDSLIAAADGDLSMTWQDAQDRLNAFDSDAYDETSDDPGESAA
jgi:hypothetical protein